MLRLQRREMKGVARSRTQIHLSGRILKNNEKKEAKNGGWGGMKEGVACRPAEFSVLWRNLSVSYTTLPWKIDSTRP